MTMGERIKMLRTRQGWSQEELGQKLGVKNAAVYKYENGLVVNLKRTTIQKLADLFGVTPAYLMGFEDAPAVPDPPAGFEPIPATKRIPIVGAIACGRPITAEENVEGYTEAPADYRADFCLRCHGDSMIDVGIVEGDLVYIKSQPEVENGQIAAVLIDGEATLKRFYRSGNVVTLVAENRAYPPIVLTGSQLDELTIEGRAVGFSHYF